MPSSNEITEEEATEDRSRGSQTSLMSVQSDTSVLTKPKSQKQHRRHFSMFSGDGDRSKLSPSSSDRNGKCGSWAICGTRGAAARRR